MARQFLNGIDLTNQKIVNLASPSTGTDGVNKNYVDNLLAGLSWKLDVRAATTTNGTLATAYANGQTIDGITLATNDRILIKNQTTQTENGIYTVNAAGAPTRATDADTTAELNNATVSVLSGTTNTLTSWTQTTVNPTIGSSNIVWAAYAVGQAYTAGNGLQLVSSAFSVLLPANSGLSASGSGLVVALQTNPGLVLGASGLAVQLQTNSGLGLGASGVAVGAGTGITVSAGTVAVDTSVVARKFAVSIGNGSLTTITVTHNLGTLDVQCQIVEVSSGATVEADIVRTTTNALTATFAVAPTTNQYRAIVQG